MSHQSESIQRSDALQQSRARHPSLGHDVFAVLRAAWTGGGPSTSPGHRRVVRTVDSSVRDVRRVQQLSVVGFADGVQSEVLLRHSQHRPISLVWVAAGAVAGDRTLLEFRQRMELVGSAADQDLLTELSRRGRGLPVHLLEELTPWGIAVATQDVVDRQRREMEREVVLSTPIPDGQHLIVDGSIRDYSREGLIGVIKSVDTQILGDESVLPDRAGWRSPIFLLPATTARQMPVVSCYLRLHDAPGSAPWSHALIRLEAPDSEVLDAACALAMQHRQGPRSGDSRWSVHLEGMHWAEYVLKALRDPHLEL